MKRIFVFLYCISSLQLAFSQGQMHAKKNDYVSITNGTTNIRYPEISDELLNATPQSYYANPDFGILPVNAPDSAIELIQKRTPTSRYYIKPNTSGNKFFIQQAYGPINYILHW